MITPTHERVLEAVSKAESLYFRLVLLVGGQGSGKTKVLQRTAQELNTTVVNVNLAVSGALLDIPTRRRSLATPRIVKDIANGSSDPVLILDNLEVLFDPGLKQDPLRLLQGISRSQSVVASWSGTSADGSISYAEASHSEYRYYEQQDALVVAMDDVMEASSHTRECESLDSSAGECILSVDQCTAQASVFTNDQRETTT